ncbi:Vegetative incompatibility protein HET-E-1 [Ilyonectria robusta]
MTTDGSSHLQSPDSNLILDEKTSIHEHGLATAACLVSGLQILNPSCPDHTRLPRVLRGIHGFHTYATEYWIEYVLSNFPLNMRITASLQFFHLSRQLSASFAQLAKPSQNEEKGRKFDLLDNRLNDIRHQDIGLYDTARKILLERQVGYLTESLPEKGICSPDSQSTFRRYTHRETENDTTMVEVTSVKSLLENYQRTVQQLLILRSYQGFSFQELERFRQDFRATAFTCRFSSCPKTTNGFKTHCLRLEHEASHSVLTCPVQAASRVHRLVNGGRPWEDFTPEELRIIVTYSSRNRVGVATSLSALGTADLDSVADNHHVKMVKEPRRNGERAKRGNNMREGCHTVALRESKPINPLSSSKTRRDK